MADNISGFFDEHGFPCMEFDLQAENSPIPKRTLTGIIDTGSTGFLQVPQETAARLSFPQPEPRSAVDVGFGDGTSRLCPVVWGYVTLGSETRAGSVIVAPGRTHLDRDVLLEDFQQGAVGCPEVWCLVDAGRATRFVGLTRHLWTRNDLLEEVR